MSSLPWHHIPALRSAGNWDRDTAELQWGVCVRVRIAEDGLRCMLEPRNGIAGGYKSEVRGISRAGGRESRAGIA